MNEPPKTWKHYDKHPLYPYSKGFWQRVVLMGDEKISFDFLSYAPVPGKVDTWNHELHGQISSNLSIVDMTTNIVLFSYVGKHIDWKGIEDQIQKILKVLIKKK